MTRELFLTDIIKAAGDLPQEAMLTLLGSLASKSREKKIQLRASQDQVSILYDLFPKREGVEKMFAALFAAAGDMRSAGLCYEGLAIALTRREAYGMAGDALMEAREITGNDSYSIKARMAYNDQVRKMDAERSSDPETNERYYTEMLRKAGRETEWKQREERRLYLSLESGWFEDAAKICVALGREAEAQKYQTLAELVKD